MSELLDAYLFHWTPERAIWIDGRTLSWDARCAGIYAGFAVGTLYQLVAGWRAWRVPPPRVLFAVSLFALPLFVDVGSVALGYRPPSNDARYLTGLLFGCTLSVALVPAVTSLAAWANGMPRRGDTLRYFAPMLLGTAATFLLKSWHSVMAFGVIEALCYTGFFALTAMLVLGLCLIVRHGLGARHASRWIVLLAVVLLVAGCAAPQPAPDLRSCDAQTFVPSAVFQPACRREICRDGRIELVEDLAAVAPVDDWAEERFCALRPLACLQAYRLKDESERWLKGLVGRYWTKKEVRYGLGDAVRHAHLTCVLAERFGPDFARGLGVAHEQDSGYLVFFRMAAPSNHCCERHMDLFNNDVGISLAGQPGSCEDKVLASLHLLRHSLCPRGTDDYPNE